MRPLSLKFRIILVVSIVVLLSGVTVAGLAAFHYGNSQEKALRAKARGIALGLSLQATDLVLINDLVSIQRLLESQLKANSDIAYIFVVRDGDVLAHTFEHGVPTELLGQPFDTPIQNHVIRDVVSTTNASYLDTAQPIFNGKAGVLRLGISKAQYLSQIRELWLEIAMLTLIILAISVGVCLLFARQVARPLENLVQAIKGVAAGNLSARVEPVSGLGEVDELAVSFNAMAERIARYTGKLQDQAAELGHAQQQARISCGIVQEVGALGTPPQIGQHLVKRLRQFMRCRDTLLILGDERNGHLFRVASDNVQISAVNSSVDWLFDSNDAALVKRCIVSNQPEATKLQEMIGPFQRAVIVPVQNQGRLLGAMLSKCVDPDGCPECESTLAEMVLAQTSGSIWRALKHQHEANRLPVGQTKEGMLELVGKSPKMLGLYHLIEDVAPTDSTVLLLGESGTGKEMVAQAIHQSSPRNGKPFVVIDCGAYPATLLESEIFGYEKGAFTGAVRRKKGRFEQAQGATILLDEIGEIPLSAQVKLLRVLQTQQIERLGGEETLDLDVRILAATNKDLVNLVREGSFREDLFYRLNVFPITLPPLRERANDVPLLARHFLIRFNREHGKEVKDFSDEAMRNMLDYQWPGNVRELANHVERAVILAKGNYIRHWDLPAGLSKESVHLPLSLDIQEKAALAEALEQCSWNKKEAARRLGISRTTIYRKIKKYKLNEPTRH